MRRLAAPSVLLFLGVVAAYLVNGRAIGAGDTLPARYLPWSLVRHQTFDLDRFPLLHDEAARRTFPLLDGIPYYLRYGDGHYRSAYAPGPGVLALPVHVLPVLLGAPPDPVWAGGLEKLSAAIITALSVVVLYWALRRLASRGWALGIALIYAFGSSSWSVSSQGLWQHGPSQLFLSILLYCLVRGLRDERYLAYSGFAMSAATAMRSTDLLLVLPVAAWVVSTHRALIPRFLVWAFPPLGALALYNLATFGSPAGGGGNTTVPVWALFSQVPLLEGLAGILVSPGRGLFVYSPIFLFSIAGCLAVWRRGPWAFRMASLGLLLLVGVVGKWFLWWGGDSWGPRLLADATPILAFFLYPLAGPLSRRPLLKGLFVVLAVVSVGAHAVGAFLYDRRWDGLADIDRNPERLWSWPASPLAFHGREALSTVRRIVLPPVSDQPTSADSPDQLAVSYQAGPIPAEASAGEPMPLRVTVTNTGRAVWLASAPGERGAVRLGWRWFLRDQEEPGGRAFLLEDVGPGESARLMARIPVPAVPGEHTLVLDMVSEGVTWFAERGSRPIRATVGVSPLGADRLLSGPMLAEGPIPAVSIATDRIAYRRGDLLGLTVTLGYPHRPRKYDGYLVLQGPGGAAFIYDGQRIARAEDHPWRAWVRNLPLPAQAAGRFTLALSDLAPGPYRWSAVLTEVGTYHAVVRASAAFRIEP